MVIRIVNEANAVIQLRRQAIEEFPQYFSSTVEEVTSLEPIAERLHSPDDFYLGAFFEEQMVGMVRFSREHGVKLRHQADVGSLFIVREQRRKGYARALMIELIAQARLREVEQLSLEVGADNQSARRLYEALGFVKYGRAPRAIKVQDRYYDEDLMILYLS